MSVNPTHQKNKHKYMGRIKLNINELRDNLPNHFSFLREVLEEFINDKHNNASPDDLKDFDNNSYLAEILVDEDGNVKISAGRDDMNLNDQHPWSWDNLKDYPQNEIDFLKRKFEEEGEYFR